MKNRLLMTVAVLLVCAGPAWCAADANSGFNTLKTLAGQWEGTVRGERQLISWKLVSGGSTMMEEMDHESMVSMYHMDGSRLMMTHYCSAHNQPRMAAEISSDGKTITFSFFDGTNLGKPHDMHMKKMVLTIQDADHMTEKWTFSQGAEEKTELFELTRKK